jgi:hypothetical protein
LQGLKDLQAFEGGQIGCVERGHLRTEEALRLQDIGERKVLDPAPALGAVGQLQG